MIFSLFYVKVDTVCNDNWIINTWSLWIWFLHFRSIHWSLITELRSATLPHSILQFIFKWRTSTHFPLFVLLFFSGPAFSGSFAFVLNNPWWYHMELGLHWVQAMIDSVRRRQNNCCLLNRDHFWLKTFLRNKCLEHGRWSIVCKCSVLKPADFGHCQSKN